MRTLMKLKNQNEQTFRVSFATSSSRTTVVVLSPPPVAALEDGIGTVILYRSEYLEESWPECYPNFPCYDKADVDRESVK